MDVVVDKKGRRENDTSSLFLKRRVSRLCESKWEKFKESPEYRVGGDTTYKE